MQEVTTHLVMNSVPRARCPFTFLHYLHTKSSSSLTLSAASLSCIMYTALHISLASIQLSYHSLFIVHSCVETLHTLDNFTISVTDLKDRTQCILIKSAEVSQECFASFSIISFHVKHRIITFLQNVFKYLSLC